MAGFGSSSSAATLVVKVVTDATDAAKGLDAAAATTSRFGSGLRRAAVPLGLATAGLVAFGTEAFNAASSAEQAAGAVDSVFKDSAGLVHDFASSAADDMGLSSKAYEEMAAVFGAQLKNMGVAADDLAPQTDDLIQVGADLAAQFGGSTSDAVSALSALMRGERDPIERYGVSIREADIKARKAAMGLDDLTGEADRQATAQATLSLLMEQTADATGAFARESDTAAGQQARATAAYEDTKAALGTALLPIVARASEMFATIAKVIGKHPRLFQVLAVAIGAVTAAVWLMNAALAANPFVLIAVAVAALVAGIVLLWENCETFRNIVLGVRDVAVAAFNAVADAVDVAWQWIKKLFTWVKSNWPKILAILTGPIGVAVLMIVKHWNTIKNAVRNALNWVKSNWPKILAILTGPVGVAVLVIVRHWDRIIGGVRRLIAWVRDILGNAFRALGNIAGLVLSGIRRAVDWVILKLGQVVGWLRANVGGAFLALAGIATSVFNTIRGAIGWAIDKLRTLMSWLRSNAGGAFLALAGVATSVFNTIRGAIQWVIDKIQTLVGWINNIHWPSPPGWLKNIGSGIGNVIGGILGRSIVITPAPTPHRYAVAPTAGMTRAMRRGTRSGSSTGRGVVINVSGALDPDAVARQIQRVLVTRARRVGGVRIGA